MNWIVGVGDAKRPADVEQVVAYVRAGAAPGLGQLVVQRAASEEYLNLFLTGERAMLFWCPDQVGLPDLLIARRPDRFASSETEVAFVGRTPDQPWFVPRRDTLRRAEGLALLEEYVCTGIVPTEIPVWAIPVSAAPFRQLLLFQEIAQPKPEPESRGVSWEAWGSGIIRQLSDAGGEEGGIPF